MILRSLCVPHACTGDGYPTSPGGMANGFSPSLGPPITGHMNQPIGSDPPSLGLNNPDRQGSAISDHQLSDMAQQQDGPNGVTARVDQLGMQQMANDQLGSQAEATIPQLVPRTSYPQMYTAASYKKYHLRRLQTNVVHVLFYVVDHEGHAKLAVVVRQPLTVFICHAGTQHDLLTQYLHVVTLQELNDSVVLASSLAFHHCRSVHIVCPAPYMEPAWFATP